MKVFAITALAIGLVAPVLGNALPEGLETRATCGYHTTGSSCSPSGSLSCTTGRSSILACKNGKWAIQASCPSKGDCRCVNGKPSCG